MTKEEYDKIHDQVNSLLLSLKKSEWRHHIEFKNISNEDVIISLFKFLRKIKNNKIYSFCLWKNLRIMIDVRAPENDKNAYHSSLDIRVNNDNQIIISFNKFYHNELDYELAYWFKNMLIEDYYLSKKEEKC